MSDPVWEWLQTQVPAVIEQIDIAGRVEQKVLDFSAGEDGRAGAQGHPQGAPHYRSARLPIGRIYRDGPRNTEPDSGLNLILS